MAAGWLEDEAIFLIREGVAVARRAALLFSGGKDSAVLLHLAARAFAPHPAPLTVLHVDTGHNFPEVLRFRDEFCASVGLRCAVASVEASIRQGRVQDAPSRNALQSVTLGDAIDDGGFDVVFGGARRDEERARAKERLFSVRAGRRWVPERQRPELFDVVNPHLAPGEHFRAFPLSNWTELDVWRYVAAHDVRLPALYFAHERAVFARDGLWYAVSPWLAPRPDEVVVTRRVRFRTVGDATCTAAVASDARTPAEVIAELAQGTVSERGATRADDRATDAAMERRKREGYF